MLQQKLIAELTLKYRKINSQTQTQKSLNQPE